MKTRPLLKLLPPVAGVALLSGCFYAYDDRSGLAVPVPIVPAPVVYTGVAVGDPLWRPYLYDGLPTYYYRPYLLRPPPPIMPRPPRYIGPPPRASHGARGGGRGGGRRP